MSDLPADRILAAIASLSASIAVRDTEILQRLGALETTQSALRTEFTIRFDKLRADLDKLRVDVMERIDRLQNVQTAQREAEIVNYGAAERAESIARGASAEVRALGDQVSGMIRQIQRLQSDVRQLRGEP